MYQELLRKFKQVEHLTDEELMELKAYYHKLLVAMEGWVPPEYMLVKNDAAHQLMIVQEIRLSRAQAKSAVAEL